MDKDKFKAIQARRTALRKMATMAPAKLNALVRKHYGEDAGTLGSDNITYVLIAEFGVISFDAFQAQMAQAQQGKRSARRMAGQ